jgi:DNA polymerase-3 subunit gamma/tau
VKSERRVTSILLNDASVDSLDGGVLTVAFAAEGQARGFAASGHDQVLTGVLAAMLGLNVRVRAAVGTGSGGGRSGPAGLAPGTGARGPAVAPRGAMDRPDDPAASPGAPGGPGAMSGGSGTPADRPAASPGGGPGAGDGAAGRKASAPRPPGPRAGATSSPAIPPAAGDIAEEWPDDAGPAEGAGPTGMELIERQLGGTIIEEIEEP